jgi:hypothetical protein
MPTLRFKKLDLNNRRISVYYWHPLRQHWIEAYRVYDNYITYTIKKEVKFWENLGFCVCVSQSK